ncbi:MAG: PH domain-containing protein [Gemmatimonadota bacterium]
MAQQFKSKVDSWFILLLVGVAIIVLGTAVVTLAGHARPSIGSWLAIAIPAPIALGLPLWMLLGTSYTIDGDTLIVRCGPQVQRVPLRLVTKVVATRSILSAPALSLDRLAISYGKGQSVVISPREKSAFLKALVAAGVAQEGIAA